MRIVVTGGTGFLGRHTVWRLAAQGHDVIFTGRNEREAQAVMQVARGVRFARIDHGADMAHRAFHTCCTGADAVVHCAALASPWGSRAAFERSNVKAVKEVLAACRDHHIAKLVHISSPSIYFTFADRLLVKEDEPLPPPVNDYARTKREAEALVLGAQLPHAVILRPRAIFGPWDNALLPRLVRLIRLGRVPLLRQGAALVDMTYVDNVVDAIEAALALPAHPLETPPVFNISNGEPIDAQTLFARIADAFDLPLHPVHRPYRVADLAARALELAARFVPSWEPPFTRYSLGAIAFSQTLDLTRARAVLGYRPRVGLDEGIARTARWWRKEHAQEAA